MAKITRAEYERLNNQAREIGGDGWKFDLRNFLIWGTRYPIRDTKVENGEIIRERLGYFPEYKRITNEYGVSYNKVTGNQVPTYTIDRLVPLESGCYRVVEIERREVGEPVARKSYVGLLKIAATIERAA